MKTTFVCLIALTMLACGDTENTTSTNATPSGDASVSIDAIVAPAQDMGTELGNPCASNPCENEGMCVESEDGQGVSCLCSGTGFEGALCNEDIDECEADIATCTPNSTCTNTEGGYDCLCDTGYSAGGWRRWTIIWWTIPTI